MRLAKHLLFFVILSILAFPLIQSWSQLVNEQKLSGFFKLEAPPSWQLFSWTSWFTGTFQEETGRRIEDHIGMRTTLFRINNEYDYRLFGIPHAQGFVQGKEGFLFEEDYFFEYTGRYFIGKKTIDYKLEKLQKVYHQLEKAGITFLLVLEPGKASFFPEYIPEQYHPEERSLSNYDYITRRAADLGIPCMNLNELFIGMKDTSSYPLFPKYGMHWSIYGSLIAADTIRNYLEYACATDLPEIRIDRIDVTDSLRWTDKDIGNMLNLIFPLPPDTLAYPVLSFDSSSGRQLSVLVVADSYYVNIIHDITKHLFKEQEYWYYNSKLYPHIVDEDNPVYVDKSDLKAKLLKFNGILLMVSEINLHCGFWNFADEAYQAFYPDHADPPWYAEQNNILNERDWFRFIVIKAKESHLSLENAIIRDAKYVYHTKNP